MAISGKGDFPTGSPRAKTKHAVRGLGTSEAAAGIVLDWLLGPAPHPITGAGGITSTATVASPSVGASAAPALVGGTSSATAPAVGAAIAPALVAGSASVLPPTVESGAEPEPEPGYGRWRPAPPVPKKKKPKPKKKPAPVFVERPAVVIVQPTEPVGVEWSDPLADEDAAVVAALYALEPW